jgi:transcriptional regulator of aromatic amino acid metabolism
MAKIVGQIEKVAPTALPVLILGENGTGKELVANALHLASGRQTEKLMVVNCAAIPRELLESELFGYEAGAFTGATHMRIGRFEGERLANCAVDGVAGFRRLVAGSPSAGREFGDSIDRKVSQARRDRATTVANRNF